MLVAMDASSSPTLALPLSPVLQVRIGDCGAAAAAEGRTRMACVGRLGGRVCPGCSIACAGCAACGGRCACCVRCTMHDSCLCFACCVSVCGRGGAARCDCTRPFPFRPPASVRQPLVAARKSPRVAKRGGWARTAAPTAATSPWVPPTHAPACTQLPAPVPPPKPLPPPPNPPSPPSSPPCRGLTTTGAPRETPASPLSLPACSGKGVVAGTETIAGDWASLPARAARSPLSLGASSAASPTSVTIASIASNASVSGFVEAAPCASVPVASAPVTAVSCYLKTAGAGMLEYPDGHLTAGYSIRLGTAVSVLGVLTSGVDAVDEDPGGLLVADAERAPRDERVPVGVELEPERPYH